MAYRKVDGVFWTDPKVRDLTEQERYLFLYCITCPSAHSSGVYYNPLPMIAYETCINEKALLKAFGRLREGLMVYYGSLSGVVFVRNMLKFQTPNAKEKISIQKHIETIQDKEILAMFLNTYPEYAKGYSKDIETLLEGYHKDIHTYTKTKTDTKTETKESNKKLDPKKSFGIEGGVKLSQDEYDKLCQEYGKSAIEEKILALENWLNKGNTAKSHNLTIRNWLRKELKPVEKEPQPELEFMEAQ